MFNDTANDGCDNTRYHAAIMFSLILLHWIILSIVPIHSTADKTNFFQPYQYTLLLINVCYTYVCRYCSESNSKKSELIITLFHKIGSCCKDNSIRILLVAISKASAVASKAERALP